MGETGKVSAQKAWPARNLDNSVHASPILFDINGDGTLEVIFSMTSGELLFYTSNGTQIKSKKYHIPPLYISRSWYEHEVIVSYKDVDKYATFSKDKAQQGTDYIPVDPHIMATPSLADINNDGVTEELVIPVSYFYEEDDYRIGDRLESLGLSNITDLERYLAAGVVVLNLTAREILWAKVLDITKVSASFPAYNLFPVTVIDLDSTNGELEIIVGTSAGTLYVFDHHGNLRDGWPDNGNTIHGQITAADLTGDGSIQLIAMDTDGNVVCYNKDGSRFWEAKISDSSSAGSRLFDMNKDTVLDVLIVTNDGNFYVLDGKNGSTLPEFPMKLGQRVWSNILITKVSSTHSVPDIVISADDGTLHLISTDLKCRSYVPIGETSLVQVLSHDLVTHSKGLELLVATNDGTLLCLGTGSDLEEGEDESKEKSKEISIASLTSETKSVNDFSYDVNKMGVYVSHLTRIMTEVTGDSFDVEFDIIDPLHGRRSAQHTYDVKIYFGRHLLGRSSFTAPGLKKMTVPTWELPAFGHVTVLMTNHLGQVFQDVFHLRFNTLIMEDLRWLLLAPFFAMIIIILIGRGFPEKDLLPYTNQSKKR
ncbi:hypothetical protein FSP39_019620 [Pinctada imbricata]|uniref:DEX1 C-terminal domain-containing protein n=1 Tax=Pinctada imbricata TaxID=66713 RepID=A0AA89C3V7_PINIB|nr:hypothetical protein FSP39_019620 [Pinctada imbricata]